MTHKRALEIQKTITKGEEITPEQQELLDALEINFDDFYLKHGKRKAYVSIRRSIISRINWFKRQGRLV